MSSLQQRWLAAGLGRLPQLNTLVLTRNRLAAPKANLLAGCTALVKLSLSHNALAELGGTHPLLRDKCGGQKKAAELDGGGCNALADHRKRC